MIGRITSTLLAPAQMVLHVAAFLHGGRNARLAEMSVARHALQNRHHERYVSRRLHELAQTPTSSTNLAIEELAS